MNGKAWSRRMTEPSLGTALVTGALSGIDAICADRLATCGHDLIPVARNEARLSAVSERLTNETGRAVNGLPADLGNTAEPAKVEATLPGDPSITMLVNNAAVPGFVARGASTIINIASVVGNAAERLNGVFGATKAFVLALSHCLQHELGDKGIRIQAVLPGATATDLWETAGLHYRNLPGSIVVSAEDMVDAALIGLDQGERVTIPPRHDGADWTGFAAPRRAVSQHFGCAVPAPRYGPSARAQH
jgi:short-subunit dehydrogenase